MLTLYRLPRSYRVLYGGIAALLAAALWSHWLRLGLRHGMTPAAIVAWYRGDETAMLFPKTASEVADDAWMNLFHHTLAFLVLGGLLVRTTLDVRVKAALAVVFGSATLLSAVGPVFVWLDVAGAAGLYVITLAALSLLGVVVLVLVIRDAWLLRARGHRGIPSSDILAHPGSSLFLLLVLLTLAASPLEGQKLLTERQALGKIFPTAQWVATDSLRPDSATRAQLERSLGRALHEPVYPVRRVFGRGKGDEPQLLGFTMVTEERGKYRPITMLIGVDTAYHVAGVQILVYREPRGGEVSREYFLRQYRGKSIGDPIRLNRDIINISGATISVQSVNAGVRKTLALLERFYPRDARFSTPRSLLPLEAIS